jgi:predicted ribosome quality control (RQC) complex YloA/Tae2 family protein
MKLSWHQIERVVTELAPRIVGGRIQKIRQPDSTTLCFSIYLRGETTHLIVSATPQVVRVSESESQGSTVEPPTALGMWTRKHAQGRRLSALTLDPDDRILRFILAEGTLVAELTGGTANLLGVDTDSILLC